MKKSMKILAVHLIILLLTTIVSCTKNEKNYTVKEVNGVKTFKNQNVNSVESLVIEPKEVFTITSADSTIQDSSRTIYGFGVYEVDSSGNIFIMDQMKNEVRKFDKDGKYIKSFGHKGTGPGESEAAWNMTILNDTIVYDDAYARQILKFDTDGNFIKKVKLPARAFERFKAISKTRIVGFQSTWEEIGNDALFGYNLTLVNSDFKHLKELTNRTIKYSEEKYNFFDSFLDPYTFSDKELFIAEKSTNAYKINAYDFDGELLYSITKNYSKKLFSDDEWEIFNKTYKNWKVNRNNKSRVKAAINQIEYDKYGRLWVFSSVKRDDENLTDLLVDIFKDGIFLKQVKLDIRKGFDFFNFHVEIRLIKDRIYYLNSYNQELKVYDY